MSSGAQHSSRPGWFNTLLLGAVVTLACISACAAPGVTRGRAGASDLRLPRPRGTRVRVHAAVGGPGTAPRTLSLRLTLPR